MRNLRCKWPTRGPAGKAELTARRIPAVAYFLGVKILTHTRGAERCARSFGTQASSFHSKGPGSLGFLAEKAFQDKSKHQDAIHMRKHLRSPAIRDLYLHCKKLIWNHKSRTRRLEAKGERGAESLRSDITEQWIPTHCIGVWFTIVGGLGIHHSFPFFLPPQEFPV